MTRFIRLQSPLIFTALFLVLLTACGGDTGDVNVPTDTVAVDTTGGVPGAPTVSSGCPSAEDVSALIKLDVREESSRAQTGEQLTCTYRAADVTLTLTRSAESGATQAFGQLTESARTLLGQAASVDSVRIGERGISYVSKTKSEAAVVADGRLYRAEISGGGTETDLGGMRGPLVALLERMMNR